MIGAIFRGALTALLSWGASPASAQWAKVDGPRAGLYPKAIAVTPATILFAGREGAYRSQDTGRTWMAVPDSVREPGGISNFPEVLSLLSVRGVVLAGTVFRGIYRSSDDGRSWDKADMGGREPSVQALAADASTLYAGTDIGVFRSSDQGLHWTLSRTGLQDSAVTSLAAGSNALLAGTFTGPFRSTDGGRTWSKVQGLGNTVSNSFALLAEGTEFFLSTADGTYRSTDNGQSWSHADSGLGMSPIPSMVAAGGSLYAAAQAAGVYRSDDRGATWHSASEPFPGNSLSFLATDGRSLFAATLGAGINRARASLPLTWERMESRGLPYLQAMSVAADGDRFYATAGPNRLVFQSKDAGRVWTESWPDFPGSTTSFYPWKGNLYAFWQNGLVSVKAAGDSSWRLLIGRQLPPGRPRYNFAFAIGSSGMFLCADGGIWRCAHGGSRWDSIATFPSLQEANILAAYGQHLAAAGFTGIHVSSDGGGTWSPSATDFTGVRIYGLRFVDSALYAATARGLMRSDDFGSRWRAADKGITGVPAGPIAGSAGALFIATGEGVFHSGNGGESWNSVSTGMVRTRVNALFPAGGRLLAATDSGVWVRPIADLIPTALSARPAPHPERGARAVDSRPGALFRSGPRRMDAIGRIQD